MKTEYEVRPPVASAGRPDSSGGEPGVEWDFSVWFAVLSPILGVLLGLVGAFFAQH
jgi:hypothetical protein